MPHANSLLRHNRPFTPEEHTRYFSELGWTREDIAMQLGFEPPTEWMWSCAFCARHQQTEPQGAGEP